MTSDDWITICAIAVGGLTSLVTICIVAALQWRSHKHETREAQEERRQERLQKAYKELWIALSPYRAQMTGKKPEIHLTNLPWKTPDVSIEILNAQIDEVALFGTDKMRALLQELVVCETTFLDDLANFLSGPQVGRRKQALQDKVSESQEAIEPHIRQIEAQMRLDLGSR